MKTTTELKSLQNSVVSIMILALITTVSLLANFILLWFLCTFFFCITYSSTASEPETRPEPEPEPTTKYDADDNAELESDEGPEIFLFKIKFGKTRKRLNVAIYDGNLNTDMPELRDRICYLFGLPRYTEIEMSYTDEDGEEITMTDENDLMDIMRQEKLQYRLWMNIELRNKQATGQAQVRPERVKPVRVSSASKSSPGSAELLGCPCGFCSENSTLL